MARSQSMRFALVVLVLALLPAADAAAAGFSPVVALTPPANHQSPAAAVAPDGRTAVVWQRFLPGSRSRVEARIGPAAGQLAPTRAIAGSALADEPRVVAAPDGTMTACWTTYPYRRPGFVRCAIAPPGRAFGAAQTLRAYPSGARFAIAGLGVDADGRAVLVWTRAAARKTTQIRWSRATGGRFGPEIALGRLSTSRGGVTVAFGDDGAVHVVWNDLARRDRALLATMAPHAARFPRPVAVDLGAEDFGTVGVTDAGALVLSVAGGGPEAFALVRRPDGTFARVPTSRYDEGGLRSFAVQRVRPDGTLLMSEIVSETANDDCSAEIRSELRVGVVPLGPPPDLPLLSDPKQLVATADLRALADGRTLAVWSDGFGDDRQSRIEFALAGPDGVFGPATTIAPVAADYPVLASGGTHAVLVYTTGTRLGGPDRIVLSELRDAPPFAAAGPRPARPYLGCA